MSKPEIIIRPATTEDVQAFHAMQESDPNHGHKHYTLESTIRAWVIEKNGKRACLAGVVLGKGYVEAFSDIAPGLDVPKRTVWRYAKILADKIKELNLPTMAFAKEIPNAPKFLESLGFTFSRECNGRKIYRI